LDTHRRSKERWVSTCLPLKLKPGRWLALPDLSAPTARQRPTNLANTRDGHSSDWRCVGGFQRRPPPRPASGLQRIYFSGSVRRRQRRVYGQRPGDRASGFQRNVGQSRRYRGGGKPKAVQDVVGLAGRMSRCKNIHPNAAWSKVRPGPALAATVNLEWPAGTPLSASGMP
jgi:hypothetical protein